MPVRGDCHRCAVRPLPAPARVGSPPARPAAAVMLGMDVRAGVGWRACPSGLVAVVLLAGIAGCAPVSGTAPLAAAGVPLQPAAAKIERWACGGTSDGCIPLLTDCVHLTANLGAGTGMVAFGDGIAAATHFHIDGIERRWNWCHEGNGYECAFIISPDGDGRYFQFRGSPDGRAKPTSLWTCSRPWFQ